MQANAITVQVDKLNNGTPVAEVFERHEEFQNRSTYVGENHTLLSRNTVQLYRTFPTKSGNFRGVAKSSVKLSKDFSVSGVDGVALLTSPLIIELNFSIPVGVSDADILAARQRAIAFLDSDDVMVALNSNLMI